MLHASKTVHWFFLIQKTDRDDWLSCRSIFSSITRLGMPTANAQINAHLYVCLLSNMLYYTSLLSMCTRLGQVLGVCNQAEEDMAPSPSTLAIRIYRRKPPMMILNLLRANQP